MEQLRLEELFLGLRTKSGIRFEDLKNQYQYDLLVDKTKMLDKLQEEGLISVRDGRLCLNPTGFAVADSLLQI